MGTLWSTTAYLIMRNELAVSVSEDVILTIPRQ